MDATIALLAPARRHVPQGDEAPPDRILDRVDHHLPIDELWHVWISPKGSIQVLDLDA